MGYNNRHHTRLMHFTDIQNEHKTTAHLHDTQTLPTDLPSPFPQLQILEIQQKQNISQQHISKTPITLF